MEVTAFADKTFLSERERVLSQLVLQLALHEDVQGSLTQYLGISDEQLHLLKGTVAMYERDLANKNPTLSQLLGKAVKSKCCT